jgi:molecular chaperone DnaK (HSP70)
MSAPTIAVDFGTTRTKVAYFDQNQNEPRLIELGQEIRAIIPSVFYIPPQGQRLVGDDAQMMVDQDPEGIIIGLKKGHFSLIPTTQATFCLPLVLACGE